MGMANRDWKRCCDWFVSPLSGLVVVAVVLQLCGYVETQAKMSTMTNEEDTGMKRVDVWRTVDTTVLGRFVIVVVVVIVFDSIQFNSIRSSARRGEESKQRADRPHNESSRVAELVSCEVAKICRSRHSMQIG